MFCIITEPDQLSKLADKMATQKIPSFDWWFGRQLGGESGMDRARASQADIAG